MIFALVLVFLALPLSAEQEWQKDLASAQKLARDSDRLMLVEMYADWCGWCKKMARELFPSERFQKATKDLVLLRLDTEDRDEGTKLSRELRVTSLPTIYLMTPDLAIAGVIQGYAPPERWVNQLQSTLDSYAEFETRVAEDTGGRTDPKKTFDLAIELAQRRFWADAEARLWGLVDNKSVPLSLRTEAMLELSRIFLAVERFEESEVLLGRLLRTSGIDDETAAVAHLMRAEMRMLANNLEGALTDLETLREKYPDSEVSANAGQFMRIVKARLGTD